MVKEGCAAAEGHLLLECLVAVPALVGVRDGSGNSRRTRAGGRRGEAWRPKVVSLGCVFGTRGYEEGKDFSVVRRARGRAIRSLEGPIEERKWGGTTSNKNKKKSLAPSSS
jgi:hypothetical protein